MDYVDSALIALARTNVLRGAGNGYGFEVVFGSKPLIDPGMKTLPHEAP